MQSVNKNLTVIYQPHYLGMPLCISKKQRGMIEEYLDRCIHVMRLSQCDFRKVFLGRFDLHFPKYFDREYMSHSNKVISDFRDNLNELLSKKEQNIANMGKRVHRNQVRFVWVREQDPENDKWHYHVAVLMNGDAYRTLNYNRSGKGVCLASVIEEAWANALKIHIHDARGLAYFPENRDYTFGVELESFPKAFYRISYFCKARTKIYGQGAHAFGSSRK